MTEYTYVADKFVFRVKKGLLYSRNEVWVDPGAIRGVRIGVTDFAQRRGGDIIFVEVQPTSSKITRGGLLGSYETIKMVQDILSPVDGLITEVNPVINTRPEAINMDPYGEGWVAVIKPTSSLDGLLSAEEYFEMMKAKVVNELKKIKGI